MTIISTLLPTYPSLTEMFVFSLVGFSVVCVVLSCLSGVTAVVGKFFQKSDDSR